ncbi:MAG: hypothetical protein JHD02_04250 [Thermoleophilaceae bacterium]|nr:hypothetical protein [Thermoleophilaceae bacterium]
MTASTSISRSLIAVFAVAAFSTFLMAAAASTIVAQADGPSEREAAFAANSVVVMDVGKPIGSAPAGARVPSLVEVARANIFSAAQIDSASAEGEPLNTVHIGISEDDPVALVKAFLDHSQKWLSATSSEKRRVRNASVDAGVRLRRLGVSALILPTGFLAANRYGCAIADGLYSGGAVPVFRLPSAGSADSAALRKCLALFVNRNATVFVERVSGGMPEGLKSLASDLTVLMETDRNGVDAALLAGVSGLLVRGESREKTASDLATSRSEKRSQLVLDAASRMSRWYANVPPIGSSPSTAAPAERKRAKRIKVKPLEDISPNRTGNDGRPVAPRAPSLQPKSKGNTNPAPATPDQNTGAAPGPT